MCRSSFVGSGRGRSQSHSASTCSAEHSLEGKPRIRIAGRRAGGRGAGRPSDCRQIFETAARGFAGLSRAWDLLSVAAMRTAWLALLIPACTSGPDVLTARKLPAAIQGDAAAVVAANNQFACDVYAKAAAGTSTNAVFSPFSISTALAMLDAGAAGNTDTELRAALHFTLPAAQLAGRLWRAADQPRYRPQLRRVHARHRRSRVRPAGLRVPAELPRHDEGRLPRAASSRSTSRRTPMPRARRSTSGSRARPTTRSPSCSGRGRSILDAPRARERDRVQGRLGHPVRSGEDDDRRASTSPAARTSRRR